MSGLAGGKMAFSVRPPEAREGYVAWRIWRLGKGEHKVHFGKGKCLRGGEGDRDGERGSSAAADRNCSHMGRSRTLARSRPLP